MSTPFIVSAILFGLLLAILLCAILRPICPYCGSGSISKDSIETEWDGFNKGYYTTCKKCERYWYT